MYQAGAACYSSVEAAALASASSQIGQIVDGKFIQGVTYNTGSLKYTVTDGAAITEYAFPVSFPECQLMTASDGLQLSWLVVAAWAVAFGFKALARTVWGVGGGND